jgi:hypothetical protein
MKAESISFRHFCGFLAGIHQEGMARKGRNSPLCFSRRDGIFLREQRIGEGGPPAIARTGNGRLLVPETEKGFSYQCQIHHVQVFTAYGVRLVISSRWYPNWV